MIIVTSDNNVQNRIILTEKPYSASELTQAGNYFNANFSGQTFDEVQLKLHTELKQMQTDMNKLMSAALEASHKAGEGDGVVIAGERNLLHVDELSTNVASLRKLFDIFAVSYTHLDVYKRQIEHKLFCHLNGCLPLPSSRP